MYMLLSRTVSFLPSNQELRVELAAVKAENAWLKRQLFGPGKSEKLDRLQANLPLAEVPASPVSLAVETISYERVVAPKEKASAAGGGGQGCVGEGNARDRARGGDGRSGDV
jgi:hypothetical protein